MIKVTPHTAPELIRTRIIFATNFAGKMDRDHFIHIAPAPKQRIPESLAARTIIQIETADGSHQPIQVNMTDLSRFDFIQLAYLRDRICQESHGMTTRQLVDWLMAKYPGIHEKTEMGIYYYSKTKTPQ